MIMENEMQIFETGISWTFKGICHQNRVSYLAKNYVDFIEKIKRDYGFADECMIYDIKYICYLPNEITYIKRRAKNDNDHEKKQAF